MFMKLSIGAIYKTTPGKLDSSLRDSHTFPNSVINEYTCFVVSGTGDLQALPLRSCDFPTNQHNEGRNEYIRQCTLKPYEVFKEKMPCNMCVFTASRDAPLSYY